MADFSIILNFWKKTIEKTKKIEAFARIILQNMIEAEKGPVSPERKKIISAS